MEMLPERSVRWDPIHDLPETVINQIAVQYDSGAGLTATAIYAGKRPRLDIRFGRPEAFKVYEEFSDALYSEGPTLDRMGETGWGQPWPFWEVENSRWIARVVERDGTIGDKPLRHRVIRSFDMILHVMSADAPVAQVVT